MQITPHFSSREFDCHSGTPYPPLWIKSRLKPLCEALELIRYNLGQKTITITSGYRTPEWNQKMGGAKDSQHCYGLAADFKMVGVDARSLYEKIEELILDGIIPNGGLGSYRTWVHYDQRGHHARWTN